MINKLIAFLKSTINRFRPEELFFCLSAIGTILMEFGSVVPALSTLLLLAFYYLFFGWYLFSVKGENHLGFSIFSGIMYAVALVSICMIMLGNFYVIFFYLIQAIIVAVIFFVLYKNNNWGLYKGNHYIRLCMIIFFNIYLSLFK